MVSLAASWLWPRIRSSLRIRTCTTRTVEHEPIWDSSSKLALQSRYLAHNSGSRELPRGLTWRNGSLTPDTSCSGE